MLKTIAAKAILPERNLGIAKYLEKKGQEEGLTNDELFKKLVDNVNSSPQDLIEHTIDIASMLRTRVNEQNMIAEGVKKQGFNKAKFIQAAVATVVANALVNPIFYWENPIIVDFSPPSVSFAAILPAKDVPLKSIIEKEAAKDGKTLEQELDALIKTTLQGNPVANIMENAASVIRVNAEDQQMLVDAAKRNGMQDEQLIKRTVAIASTTVFMQEYA